MIDIWNWVKAMVQHSDLYVVPWYKPRSYIFGFNNVLTAVLLSMAQYQFQIIR